MRYELFCGALTDGSVSAVLFPAVGFFSEFLQPLILEQYVDCTFRVLHAKSSDGGV
jgi:hypothetical protein